ncbi:hypothetical protein OESDEN_07847 [Oesophagostomum dentatum]|uniref:Sushi domain-containing protein n=1 Tax=Oesophagostomum dentatum TaxID=61180 RepID=A0A0B1TA69_OESDE|nr:hypothetical protein OESDEN_07847 [Oesophagostomum dentatum]
MHKQRRYVVIVLAIITTTALALKVCPRCYFSIYIERCELRKDRKTCYTAKQANVQKRENGGKSCILTYQCPEPLVAYGTLLKTLDLQRLRMQITCPSGTNAYVFNSNGYTQYTGNPIQCVDNGQDTGTPSVWTTVLPGGNTQFQSIACLSAT